jgi:hypothetical protein
MILKDGQLEAARARVIELEAECTTLNAKYATLANGFREVSIERGTLRAEVERMRPVVEIAENWTDNGTVTDEALFAAVRTYRATQTAQGR